MPLASYQAGPARRSHWQRFGRKGAALGAVVVVSAGGLAARSTFTSSSGTPSFRTAAVTRASVTETLTRSGTIEPISQASVAFPLSGTVATVAVHVGDPVSAGTVLATLDTTSLQSQLAQKKAARAEALLTLHKDVTAAATAATTTTTTTTTTVAAPATDAAQQAIGDAAQQVAVAQHVVDAALAKAKTSMDTATTACTTTPAVAATTATPVAVATSATATTPATAGDCTTAAQASFADQQGVASAQSALDDAQAAYAKLLDGAARSASSLSSSAGRNPSASGTSSGTSSGGAGTGNGGSGGASPASITPQQLVADQAAVDAAQGQIDVVDQSLAQATIVSPLAGTVAAVGLRVGQPAAAGSSTAAVVVVGTGGYEVASAVAVTDITKVKVGNTATVVPDGTKDRVAGTVVSIGVVPTTAGSATTYPVVIGVTGTSPGLRNGASATVGIQVAHTATAITVPTSAVRSFGNLHVATVLVQGKQTTAPVQVGTVGAERTEITSGLQVGEVVVLADLGQAIPSSNTTNNGGFGGGGFGGGGGGFRFGGVQD